MVERSLSMREEANALSIRLQGLREYAAAVRRLSSVVEHWSCKPRVESSILSVACHSYQQSGAVVSAVGPSPTDSGIETHLC
eukprot:gene17775-biopygen23370